MHNKNWLPPSQFLENSKNINTLLYQRKINPIILIISFFPTYILTSKKKKEKSTDFTLAQKTLKGLGHILKTGILRHFQSLTFSLPEELI